MAVQNYLSTELGKLKQLSAGQSNQKQRLRHQKPSLIVFVLRAAPVLRPCTGSTPRDQGCATSCMPLGRCADLCLGSKSGIQQKSCGWVPPAMASAQSQREVRREVRR